MENCLGSDGSTASMQAARASSSSSCFKATELLQPRDECTCRYQDNSDMDGGERDPNVTAREITVYSFLFLFCFSSASFHTYRLPCRLKNDPEQFFSQQLLLWCKHLLGTMSSMQAPLLQFRQPSSAWRLLLWESHSIWYSRSISQSSGGSRSVEDFTSGAY